MTFVSSYIDGSRHMFRLARLGLTIIVVSIGIIISSERADAAPMPSLEATVSATPTYFSSSRNSTCGENKFGEEEPQACNTYNVYVTNQGEIGTSGTVTVEDRLPAGLTLKSGAGGSFSSVNIKASGEAGNFNCGYINGDESTLVCNGAEKSATCQILTESNETRVSCEINDEIPSYKGVVIELHFLVSEALALDSSVSDNVSVFGGGSPKREVSVDTPIRPESEVPLGIENFSFKVENESGAFSTQAGGHPSAVTAGFNTTTLDSGSYGQPNNITSALKDAVVQLPLGLVGNPLAVPSCPEALLVRGQNGESNCPTSSEVGVVAIVDPGGIGATSANDIISAVYNITPDKGYPAEFGFSVDGKSVYMHASVVRVDQAYYLQMVVPGIPGVLGTEGAYVTLFGEPSRQAGLGAGTAFLSNPENCSAGAAALTPHLYIDTDENPGEWVTEGKVTSGAIAAQSQPLLNSGGWITTDAETRGDATPYPSLVSGCENLSFSPTFTWTPEGNPGSADAPSGYTAEISVPQAPPSQPEALSTPPLKNVEVSLPPGVAFSPAAAQGLAACTPAQISLESVERASCPDDAQIGEVEVVSPLLRNPLSGHAYVAQPECGGVDESPCENVDAEDGKLFGLYLEVEGEGVRIKLAGTVDVNPTSGQLTVHFDENPQLPFEKFVVRLSKGPRAPLASPQDCGTFIANATLEPWSSPFTPSVDSGSDFGVVGCDQAPFAPVVSAGLTGAEGDSSSSFVFSASRHDGEPDLSSISTKLPAGLLGAVANVQECPEGAANAGTCELSSEIGSATVAVGSGSQPLVLGGNVYFTGPSNGQPFGLSVVVPGVAGPYNLGNIVTRASISVDPITAALTVQAKLPEVVDGIPIRLKNLDLNVNRAGFLVAPTDCAPQSVITSIASSAGSTAVTATPFASVNCASLQFQPKLTASVSGKDTKQTGAKLVVKIAVPSGRKANLQKLALEFPSALPTQLKTLQLACLEAEFNRDPAACPSGSDVGIATVHTPLLSVPLSGPVYLVSHGGEAFPSVVMLLQGQGIELKVTGSTRIKGGRTFSHFDAIPDAPVTSIEFTSFQGKDALFATHEDLCNKQLTMPVSMVGQNGAQIKSTVKMTVTACARKSRHLRTPRRSKQSTKVKRHHHS